MIYTFASSIVRQQKPFWGSQLVESIVDLRCNGSARLSWHFWTGAVAKVAARDRAGGRRRAATVALPSDSLVERESRGGLEQRISSGIVLRAGGVPKWRAEGGCDLCLAL